MVVVDNSDSADEVARLQQALPRAADLVVAPRNLGFGKACNLAIERAPAAFVWLVNPDARVLPGCLTALRQALETDQRLGAVAPLQYLDSPQQWLFSPAWLPGSIDHWVRLQVRDSGHHRRRYDRAVRAETVRLWSARPGQPPLRQRALSGSNLLLRRACIDQQLGLFDPAFFMYFEDSDLCMRLRKRGWRLAVVPAAGALHLWHLSAYKHDLMEQARPLYFERHFARSRWLLRAAERASVAAEPQPDWPSWCGGDWVVPEAWQQGWSLEISPTDLFSPSIGRIGQGPAVGWPVEVVSAMPGARLYARLGPVGSDSLPLCRGMG